MYLPRRSRAGVLVAVLTAAGALVLHAPRAEADKPEILPLSKVKRGQKGYGMTTMAGTTSERFEFEVLGVLRNMLPDQDIILFRSDDPKLKITGIWGGMSGSPMYIDGKLACALSYGWGFNKEAVGGCTPIEDMIAESQKPIRGNKDVVKVNGGKKKKGKAKAKKTAATHVLGPQVATAEDWAKLTPSSDLGEAMGTPRQPWILSAPRPPRPASATGGDRGELMTASVPLAIAGFAGDGYAVLESLFTGYGIEPVRAGGTGGPSVDAPTSFAGGNSIAVQLIRGDMSIAATGTVTMVEGDRILAFGHPMFGSGETYAPVATAEVLGVLASAARPFVIAQPANEAGALVQDRQTMILADTSLRHPMIPVDIYMTVGEGKSKQTHEFHVEVWNNRYFTGGLTGAAAIQAVNALVPDRDHTTAKITSTLKLKGVKAFTFVDYLYSSDGATSVVFGARALRALAPLLMNPWAPVQVENVKLEFDFTFQTNYGDIKRIKLPKMELAPGERYMVEVVLETYGNKDVVDQVPIEIPESLAGQIVTLEIAPGDAARLDAAPAVDLDSLIKAIRKLLPGNVYAASLYAAGEGIAVGGIAVSDLPASAHDKLRPQTATQTVDAYRPIARTLSPAKRVVNGTASVMVKIADKKR
jgi:hypothetical protein